MKNKTSEEIKEYNHKRYMKDREHRLQYQKEYYEQHKKPTRITRSEEERKEYHKQYNHEYYKKNRKYFENKYRIKCGLKVIE